MEREVTLIVVIFMFFFVFVLFCFLHFYSSVLGAGGQKRIKKIYIGKDAIQVKSPDSISRS